MSDKKVLERLFTSAKKMINTYLNNYYDDSVAQINHYFNLEFESIEDIEDLREKVNEVSIDEVIELNKKIHLNTIYMLKGDNN
jgi:predicted Zn-dependent peptidase